MLHCMETSFAAIVGGIGGGLAVLLIIILCFWFLMSQRKDISNKNSDSGSSAPSAVVEMRRGEPSSSIAAPLGGSQEARQFRLEELEQATRNFSETNLIGYGSFGMAFKGLLCDGTVVAVKRHSGAPRQEFTQEVTYLSRIRHRNLVTLLGYCQDSGYQMLVFEYLPNGSICNHLYGKIHFMQVIYIFFFLNTCKCLVHLSTCIFHRYLSLTDTGKDTTKLEFKQRLSIGIGAAKGLRYLHGQNPSVVHGNFKTANVLVDENFIAKVADAGISKLLEKIEDAGPSSSSYPNAFRDPEMFQMGRFRETSDVYSFGVFLLELITGRETSNIDAFGSSESIIQWVEEHLNSNDLVDHRLVGSFTAEGMRDLIKVALQCMSFPGRLRPNMGMVVSKLDQILEKEIMLTTVTGEGTETVTLGSQLFTN